MKKILLLLMVSSVIIFSNSGLSELKMGDSKNTVNNILGKESEVEDNELVFYNVWFEDIYINKLALGFSNNKLVYWRGIGNLDSDKLRGLAFYYDGKYKSLPFDKEENDEILVFKSVKNTNAVYLIIDKHRMYQNGTFDVIISEMSTEGRKIIEANANKR